MARSRMLAGVAAIALAMNAASASAQPLRWEQDANGALVAESGGRLVAISPLGPGRNYVSITLADGQVRSSGPFLDLHEAMVSAEAELARASVMVTAPAPTFAPPGQAMTPLYAAPTPVAGLEPVVLTPPPGASWSAAQPTLAPLGDARPVAMSTPVAITPAAPLSRVLADPAIPAASRLFVAAVKSGPRQETATAQATSVATDQKAMVSDAASVTLERRDVRVGEQLAQAAPLPLLEPAAPGAAPMPAEPMAAEPMPAEPAPLVPPLPTAQAFPGLQGPGVEPNAWKAEVGRTLRQVLDEWAAQAGWTLVWLTDREYPLEASALFEGDFLGSAGRLVRAFRLAVPPPHATFYKGNRVVVIHAPEGDER